MNLIAFKQKLETMDWTYEYSDSHQKWRQGHAHLADILKDLSRDGTLMPIFRQYSNKYPNQSVLNAILKTSGLS